MSRNFVSASSQYLERTGALVIAHPFTVSAWVRRDANVAATIFSIMTSVTASNGFRLEINGARSVRAIAIGIGTGVAATVATASENVWHHVAAVFESTTSRHVYLNGGNKVTNTTSASPGVNPDVTTIGRIGGHTPATYWTGDIAELTVWNVVLTDQEVAILAKGIRSRRLRPINCIAYYPLWGTHSPEIDLVSIPNSMTVTGATRGIGHAPVEPFSGYLWGTMPIETAMVAPSITTRLLLTGAGR